MRASFYADDAALFINPEKCELEAVQLILKRFGVISGLTTNFQKCVAYQISCGQIDMNDALADFQGLIGTLPCRYLGLPLSFRNLRRIEMMPTIEKIAGKLKPWKGKLMNRTGRLVLINMILTSTATYFLTSFVLTSWAIKKIDKLRRG